jgi:hypothetical protein
MYFVVLFFGSKRTGGVGEGVGFSLKNLSD